MFNFRSKRPIFSSTMKNNLVCRSETPENLTIKIYVEGDDKGVLTFKVNGNDTVSSLMEVISKKKKTEMCLYRNSVWLHPDNQLRDVWWDFLTCGPKRGPGPGTYCQMV